MKVVTLACAGGSAAWSELDDVIYVDELCHRPEFIERHAAGADRLVLVLHPNELALSTLQRHVRAAGIDPLAIQVLRAPATKSDNDRLRVLIAGACARVAAQTEGEPDHARPVFGGPRTRRELLTVPRPHYEAVPLVDGDACAANSGCSACVTECPRAAYRWNQGRVLFDKDACVACGRCITACPRGAISAPTVSPTALHRQIEALLDTACGEIGVAFVCRRRTEHITNPNWYEVEVPCTGMVPPTWPVAALLLGAASAAVLSCASTGCELDQDRRVSGSIALGQALLASSGFDIGLISDEPGALGEPLAVRRDLNEPFGVHGPAEVVLALAELTTVEQPVSVVGPGARLGVVEIDTSACTLCLACSETCPTGALAHDRPGGRVSLTFDASLCTACAQCVPVCPEVRRGAIRMVERADTTHLAAGRRTLADSEATLCDSCGRPIAATAMLDRIGAMLGEEHAATLTYVRRRCVDCRGA